jgi:hypothetical protein
VDELNYVQIKPKQHIAYCIWTKHREKEFSECCLSFDGTIVINASFVKNLGMFFDRALGTDHLTCRGVGMFFFVSFRKKNSDNTRVRIFFSKILHWIRLFFFPPPKSESFFQQHWESEYFFRKKPSLYTSYALLLSQVSTFHLDSGFETPGKNFHSFYWKSNHELVIIVI